MNLVQTLLTLWNTRGANGQAALVGAAVSALVGLCRKYRPAWFANPDVAARWNRMGVVVLVCAVGVVAKNLGWPGGTPFLAQWIAAVAAALAGHDLVATTGA